ncbi:transcriptional corepressor LEUNIG_HOMOLOG isoform X4 [Gossypium hirsutum]|uniref:Transcriptional corepressor LEUNIG_HOMOLOG isoform X4 n=1 Tax=Gossypium hirsutum TaxID=3635 RepID=A0ABM3AGQ5_GOSHI|nr:transcriptional corepressor LEUNIG_HOMOLOG-like isoform X4 [Gossypium hirsutum]
MAQSNWEADKMLDVYIHDYLLKRKLHASAKAFMTEGKVATDPVAIDAPGGFLFEWWSVFWDIFIARTNEKHSEAAAAYIESQQLKAREQQQLQMQQLQLMQHRNAQLQRRDPSHPALGGSVNTINSEGMIGQPSASVLAMKMYEERVKHPHSADSETSSALIDANRMALLKTQTNNQVQLLQGSPGNMSAALQQIQLRTPLTTDIKTEVSLGGNPKSLPMDPSSIYGQAILQPKSGLGGAVLNQGVPGLPLRGWPLTMLDFSAQGIDQLRPSLGVQMQKPNLQTQNQFVLTSQQQHVLAQAQLQGNLGNSTTFVNAKVGQSVRNNGSICSPVPSSSPKMKMGQMSHSSSQQQDQLQQQQQQQQPSQQLQQNNRKRKQHSASGAANSTGTGNTGPSPSSPPSTHTPGDAITSATSLQHVNSVSKSMMYGADATAGLTSSSNLLEDMDRFDPLDENMESLLSHESDSRDIYGTIKQYPPEHPKESAKGFTFAEVGCIQTRNSEVTCCHFSSDGKVLASAGHDKKPGYCVKAYNSHPSPVMSLDFHPKKTDLFCFCDNDNEIRYFNLNTFSCTRISKGGMAQVRFQPRIGHFLAAASDKVVSIFDVETDRQTLTFKGHSEIVNYICWDANGEYLASVSHNLVKIWSLVTGECIQELGSGGNQFHSCVFHPNYSTLLVIGGISSLELWNMAENKSMTISAHENIISALAQSPVTGMVASASHDSSVKLWK